MTSPSMQKAKSVQAQSYGGGVQSVALAILNAKGVIDNPARLAIFADPGSEDPGTYAHLTVMAPWLREHGTELVLVKTTSNAGAELYDYCMTRGTPIPVRSENGGLGRRQCTHNWKVEAIKQELRRRSVTEAGLQLGISYDEIHRMKYSGAIWLEHHFPLVDLRLTRADCREVIRAERLPQPPKSACFFCPLQPVARWERRRAEQPDIFELAAVLEDRLIDRAQHKGRSPVFLSSRPRRLREAFPAGQFPMTLDDGDEGECGGYCFT